MTEASTLPRATSTVDDAPWRDAWWAVLVGGLAYWLSCLLVPPSSNLADFGRLWQTMSADPFAFPGALPHRILAPLLAWSIGFGGEPLFPLFVRGLSVLLLATVFFFSRRRDAAMVDAALITVAVAVISPVQIYKQHWVGYIDALLYTLFFLMLLAARRPALFWSLFCAALLTHELSAFLLPWLWFVRRRAGGSWRVDAVGAVLALALYTGFYLYVKSVAPAWHYDAAYFLRDQPIFPGGTVAVIGSALTHWVVAFGPILAVLAWFQHDPDNRGERGHLWWVLLGTLAIFCIAYDFSRHTNLLVLPLVIASVRFLARGHRLVYAGLVVLGAVLMLRWSPWPSISWPTVNVFAAPLLVETGILVVVSPEQLAIGPLSNALTRWLPAVLPTLAPILAILAAIWLLGFFIARRRNQGRADIPEPVR